jgi:hypothetical protein
MNTPDGSIPILILLMRTTLVNTFLIKTGLRGLNQYITERATVTEFITAGRPGAAAAEVDFLTNS